MQIIFTARRYAKHGKLYAVVVCLSVTLRIVSKRLNVGSRK